MRVKPKQRKQHADERDNRRSGKEQAQPCRDMEDHNISAPEPGPIPPISDEPPKNLSSNG